MFDTMTEETKDLKHTSLEVISSMLGAQTFDCEDIVCCCYHTPPQLLAYTLDGT